MSKAIKDNYLTRENGCKILEVSYQKEGSFASGILSDNQRELWFVERKLPQHCIIDTSSMRNYPKFFNRVGFFCWHEYQSNPALIEIAYSNGQNDEWVVAGKIRLELKSEKQHFKIKEIPITEMKQLKVTLLENFGDKNTYLNQIQLGFAKEANVPEPTRDKTYSDFRKLTSTEKQLKSAQDQIKKLTIENEQIKHTLKKQGEMILEMQGAFKIVTKELQKLQKIQQLQTQNYVTNQKSKSKQIDKIIDKKMKNKLNYGTHSSQSQKSDSLIDEKKFIGDKMNNNKKPVNLLSKASQSYAKSHVNSNKKSREHIFQEMRNSKGTIRHSKNQGRKKETQCELSEYSASQHEDEQSKYSQKCSEMMVKLQFLLAERQRRQKELKRKSQRSNS